MRSRGDDYSTTSSGLILNIFSNIVEDRKGKSRKDRK